MILSDILGLSRGATGLQNVLRRRVKLGARVISSGTPGCSQRASGFPEIVPQVLPELSPGVVGVTIVLSSLNPLMLFPALQEAEAVFMKGAEVKVRGVHGRALKR